MSVSLADVVRWAESQVPSLEEVICDERWFGLTEATPLQRAICRIADGSPLGELGRHPDVLEAVGAGQLPGVAPAELYLLAAIRSFKSLFAAGLGFRASQVCDLSGIRPGEVPRVSIVSLKLDLAKVVFGHLCGAIEQSPAIKRLAIGEPSNETVTFRHPSGRPVEVKVVAGARAGAGLVARWSAGAIFDEAPRMVGAEDGVVNFDDARKAVIGRFLPGAQLVALGSPWFDVGPMYEVATKCWGKPSRDLIVLRGRGPAMNPTYWTPERCADLQRRDPQAYRTDVLGEFAVLREWGYFDARAVDAAKSERYAPQPGDRLSAGADAGFVRNSSTLAVVAHRPDGMVLPVDWLVVRPGVTPLKPSEVVEQFADMLKRYGLNSVMADAHYRESIAEHLGLHGIVLIDAPEPPTVFADFRARLHEGRARVPNTPELLRDLKEVTARPTATGRLSIKLPSRSDGSHSDLLSALVLAAYNRGGVTVQRPDDVPEWLRADWKEAEEYERRQRRGWDGFDFDHRLSAD